MNNKSCCTPNASHNVQDRSPLKIDPASVTPNIEIIKIPGGRARVGTDFPIIIEDEEGPARSRKIKPYAMMQTTVTNALFAAFVADTAYITEAEKFGWSFVFYRDLTDKVPETLAVQGIEWWRRVDGANWRLIHGPGSEKAFDPEHPVTQVSWRDAQAFAKWAGGRLPNEAEWEHAARGGLQDSPFPWGENEPDDLDFQPCNIWQGDFPHHNSAKDGYLTTAPAKSFQPNGYGLYNMCGNVWEWTSEPMRLRSLSKRAKDRMRDLKGAKLLKGGSFLCHRSYCFRYRIPARSFNTPDTATPHQGFRLAFDIH